jgi:hypothetical protein
MINRLVVIAIVVPIAIVLIALAVANRSITPFTLDPFNPGNPGLTVHLPLFVLLFAAGALGMIVGSFATWLKQGHYRRLARQRALEAENLRAARKKDLQSIPGTTLTALPKPTV